MRNERFYKGVGDPEKQRTPAQKDRDRVLHSSALRRLAGVTQVIDPAEGQVFHNRLTHTLKVAQIGRRLAEKLLRENPDRAESLGGLDPEVVETAALCHDLGHPPFGHVAEEKLDELASREDADGYEGNAQSFRIITKLAVRYEDSPGLNLTRATLDATLKYPWFRQTDGPEQRKWGAYHTEKEEFKWVRTDPGDRQKTLEAALMDWADDIAYSVHDMEDFYRAGLVPLHLLATSKGERESFLTAVFERWSDNGHLRSDQEELARVLGEFFDLLPIDEPYYGTRTQKAALRETTSLLINRYVNGVEMNSPRNTGESRVKIDEQFLAEITLLKELTWHYVILNPALTAQQYGKAKVIETLFRTYMDAIGSKQWRSVFPPRFRDEVRYCFEHLRDSDLPKKKVRLAADVISSMTDDEALRTYRRLTGHVPGSALEGLAGG